MSKILSFKEKQYQDYIKHQDTDAFLDIFNELFLGQYDMLEYIVIGMLDSYEDGTVDSLIDSLEKYQQRENKWKEEFTEMRIENE